MIRLYVDESYATVSARADIDGMLPQVVLCPNRDGKEADYEVTMTPKTARLLARRLTQWARALEGMK